MTVNAEPIAMAQYPLPFTPDTIALRMNEPRENDYVHMQLN